MGVPSPLEDLADLHPHCETSYFELRWACHLPLHQQFPTLEFGGELWRYLLNKCSMVVIHLTDVETHDFCVLFLLVVSHEQLTVCICQALHLLLAFCLASLSSANSSTWLATSVCSSSNAILVQHIIPPALPILKHYNQPRIVSTQMKLTQKVDHFTVFCELP